MIRHNQSFSVRRTWFSSCEYDPYFLAYCVDEIEILTTLYDEDQLIAGSDL